MIECYDVTKGCEFLEAVFGGHVRDLPLPPGERGLFLLCEMGQAP
ncbi:hypothetical protein [Azospirillum endophyticum]